jgi:hypothetical protein
LVLAYLARAGTVYRVQGGLLQKAAVMPYLRKAIAVEKSGAKVEMKGVAPAR